MNNSAAQILNFNTFNERFLIFLYLITKYFNFLSAVFQSVIRNS